MKKDLRQENEKKLNHQIITTDPNPIRFQDRTGVETRKSSHARTLGILAEVIEIEEFSALPQKPRGMDLARLNLDRELPLLGVRDPESGSNGAGFPTSDKGEQGNKKGPYLG